MHVFLELAVNEEDLGFQKFDILALVKHGSFQVLVLSLHVVVLKLELDNVVVGLDILVNAQCFACLVLVCIMVFNKQHY